MHFLTPDATLLGVNKGLYVLLSRTQAEPGRTVKQDQEEISCNHVQAFIPGSVVSHSVLFGWRVRDQREVFFGPPPSGAISKRSVAEIGIGRLSSYS